MSPLRWGVYKLYLRSALKGLRSFCFHICNRFRKRFAKYPMSALSYKNIFFIPQTSKMAVGLNFVIINKTAEFVL
jgi:hypothetical protein